METSSSRFCLSQRTFISLVLLRDKKAQQTEFETEMLNDLHAVTINIQKLLENHTILMVLPGHKPGPHSWAPLGCWLGQEYLQRPSGLTFKEVSGKRWAPSAPQASFSSPRFPSSEAILIDISEATLPVSEVMVRTP